MTDRPSDRGQRIIYRKKSGKKVRDSDQRVFLVPWSMWHFKFFAYHIEELSACLLTISDQYLPSRLSDLGQHASFFTCFGEDSEHG